MRNKDMTLAYVLLQSSYWMSFCVCVCFAVIYLQGIGFSNTKLGILSALGNLIGMILGPYLAGLTDKDERWPALKLMPYMLVLQTLSCAALLAVMKDQTLSFIFYVLYMSFCVSFNTLVLKIYSDISYAQMKTDYSLARGLGSLSFVIISAVLGVLIEKTSVRAVPVSGLILCVYQYIAYRLTKKQMPEVRYAASEKQSVSMGEFIRENGRFFLMLCGTALLFFSHNNITGFLINVVRNAGGDAGTAGFLNSFMAVMELPFMFFYTKLFGKMDQKKILAASFLFFSIKELCFALAGSLRGLYLSFLFQGPSFALYSAAIVPYVEMTVGHQDSGKAQSLAYTMTTLGSVLSSVFAGRLYDLLSVSSTLWISFVVSLFGTLTAVLAMKGMKRWTKN